jgi:protease II
MAGGHGGASGRYDALRDAAFVDAFLLAVLGLEKQ